MALRHAVAGVATAAALLVAAVPAPAGGAVLARDTTVVRGYPRCGLDGVPHGWVWYEGDTARGVTSGPFLELDNAVVPATSSDCKGAAECLTREPRLAGRMATIIGSGGDDRLNGTPGPDLMVGRSGNDELRGLEGRDVICGGPGRDIVRGGPGADNLAGDAGRDVIIAGRGRDTMDGGDDLDVMYGEGGVDVIRGGPGDDACFGGAGADTIAGCRVVVAGGVEFGASPFREYQIDVEAGITAKQVEVEAEVDRILADGRSWIGDERTGFRRVSSGADFTIIVASPDTVDRLCAPLDTGGYLSCRNGSKVILNVDRWNTATDWWPTTIEVYHEYLVNHEVGHLLGHGHVSCPGSGRVAPVMMQQTKGLDGCLPNGWVYP
jgi:Ca2+-binding RTX toxin-like protein